MMNEFEKLGGMEMLKKINKIFYDKIYAHPWIGLYFKDVPQETIESQQTDFMAQSLGGPAKYGGKFVLQAHVHINITEELFLLREQLLQEAFEEAGATEELRMKWNKIDNAFKKSILKNSVDDCKKRFNTDTILDFPNPDKKAA